MHMYMKITVCVYISEALKVRMCLIFLLTGIFETLKQTKKILD